MISAGPTRDSASPTASGLPQKTQSLCPHCLTVLPAVLCQRDGRVWMTKTCPDHGEFVELISPDVAFFDKMDRRQGAFDESHRHMPARTDSACPRDCGPCRSHKSSAMMINIDLTNRCNLRCPVCFANADTRDNVYEVTVDQVDAMMANSFQVNKIRPPCVQFSGGEPTLHRDFIDILRHARQAGFAQIQAASNGLAFARDLDLACAASEAGLNVVYLQFDGVSDDVYRATRGRALWEIKQRAVENITRAGMQICLVPTLVRGVNDHQIGDIYRFAVEHADSVVAISFQPVAFTGRIEFRERVARRFTTADVARCLHDQTGGQVDMYRDWYPLSFVAPFSKVVEAITGEPTPVISCHKHCGAGTYVVVDRASKQALALPAFVDVEPLMARMAELARGLNRKRWFKRLTLMRALKDLPHYFHADRAPDGWDPSVLMTFMNSFVEFRQRYPDNEARITDVKQSRWRYLTLMTMHFQDVYNYQVPRVQRCVIHCAAPDGRFYPFCTYNCGPVFRNRVEAQFARRTVHPVRRTTELVSNNV